MNVTPTKSMPCRQCGKPIQWHDAYPHRPFCSQRCQLIDLGAWAEEKFTIPAPGSVDSTQD